MLKSYRVVGGWVVAYKILLSAPVPIGIGIRGLGLGLDNFSLFDLFNISMLLEIGILTFELPAGEAKQIVV